MALSPSAKKPDDDSEGSPAVHLIEAELAALRKEVSALARSLSAFGKTKVDDLSDRAQEMSEDLLQGKRRAIKALRKQLNDVEQSVEKNVKEHPLSWFFGALGLGVLVALLVRRS